MRHKALTPEELRDLLFCYCNVVTTTEKKSLENKIIQGCHNLVFSFCRNLLQHNAYVTEEILQEGKIGFWEALKRCDKDQIEKGFLAYAKKYVLAYVLKYLANAPMIPYWKRTWEYEVIREVRKWEKERSINNKKSLWCSTLSEDYEIHAFIDSLLPRLVRRSRKTVTFTEVQFVLTSYFGAGCSCDKTFLEGLVDDSNPLQWEDLEYLQFVIQNSDLSEKQQSIIKRRYLSGSDEQVTMKSIGDEQGVSREAIRQLEERAILKMKKTNNWIMKNDVSKPTN